MHADRSSRVVEYCYRCITEQLSNGNSINLQGFGTLKPWHQTLRDGRNPKTGVPVTIPPRISVKFRPGKFLLEALNKSE